MGDIWDDDDDDDNNKCFVCSNGQKTNSGEIAKLFLHPAVLFSKSRPSQFVTHQVAHQLCIVVTDMQKKIKFIDSRNGHLYMAGKLIWLSGFCTNLLKSVPILAHWYQRIFKEVMLLKTWSTKAGR